MFAAGLPDDSVTSRLELALLLGQGLDRCEWPESAAGSQRWNIRENNGHPISVEGVKRSRGELSDPAPDRAEAPTTISKVFPSRDTRLHQCASRPRQRAAATGRLVYRLTERGGAGWGKMRMGPARPLARSRELCGLCAARRIRAAALSLSALGALSLSLEIQDFDLFV